MLGVSTGGYGLSVSGNLRFTGGNTNPLTGAKLTCQNEEGNAVWQISPRVAFKAWGAATGYRTLPAANSSNSFRLHFGGELFDIGNNYQLLAPATTPTVNSSTFTAPIDGIYLFLVGADFQTLFYSGNSLSGTISLIELTQDGELGKGSFGLTRNNLVVENGSTYSSLCGSGQFTVYLQAGRKVFAEATILSGYDVTLSYGTRSWFSGFLLQPK